LGHRWVAEEALAIGLCCALIAPNFEEAVVVAVNHSGDRDSTGAIAGKICGALYGDAAIPARWVDSLELRMRSPRFLMILRASVKAHETWTVKSYWSDIRASYCKQNLVFLCNHFVPVIFRNDAWAALAGRTGAGVLVQQTGQFLFCSFVVLVFWANARTGKAAANTNARRTGFSSFRTGPAASVMASALIR
jgi:hypothetical protein